MTDLCADFKSLAGCRPFDELRGDNAAGLFDGDDAAIDVLRRLRHGIVSR